MIWGHDWLAMVPFLARTNDGKASINSGRVIEAVIIAVIAGAFSGYIAIAKVEVQVGHINKQVDRIQTKLDKLMEDVYRVQPWR